MPTPVWHRFFNTLVPIASAIQSITVTASPFTYTAGQRGQVVVTGGTVSAIDLTRDLTTISLGITSGSVAVSNADRVTVTYSGTPTISFIPG